MAAIITSLLPNIHPKRRLSELSIKPTNPIVIDESLGLIAVIFFILVSKVSYNVPKKQLSSPWRMPNPLGSGSKTVQYSFKKVISLSAKQCISILVHNSFISTIEFSVTRSTA